MYENPKIHPDEVIYTFKIKKDIPAENSADKSRYSSGCLFIIRNIKRKYVFARK